MPALLDFLYREYCRARLAEMREQLLISPKVDEVPRDRPLPPETQSHKKPELTKNPSTPRDHRASAPESALSDSCFFPIDIHSYPLHGGGTARIEMFAADAANAENR
jgi:hypothetical protein